MAVTAPKALRKRTLKLGKNWPQGMCYNPKTHCLRTCRSSPARRTCFLKWPRNFLTVCMRRADEEEASSSAGTKDVPGLRMEWLYQVSAVGAGSDSECRYVLPNRTALG